MNEQERIAIEVFSKYGLDFKDATRAGGWTNAVWLNGDYALRLSFNKESNRIRREVRLAEYLPDAVGYPVNFEVGITDGYEWSLSKRIYGSNLSEVWSKLSWSERTDIIEQILSIMEQVHKVDISKIEDLSNKRAWYTTFDVQETYSCLEKYKEQKIFSKEQINTLYGILERFWEKHNLGAHVLNHGDITMDNILYSHGRIVSLMDFEHSVIAPSEIDLHSLINLAFFSEEGNLVNDNDIHQYNRYRREVIGLLKPVIANPHSADLLLGYSTLFRMRFLEFWLKNPEGELENLDSYNQLLSLANGQGGYLSEIIYSQV